MELDVKKVKRIFDGFLKIDELEIQLPNGETIERELVYKKDSTAIIAIDENNQVILTKQPRAGSGKLESIEIPAGLIEANEKPIEAAKRELKEETGCVAEEWIDLGNYYPDPACCTSKSYLFYAKNAKKVSELNLDPDEFIETFRLKIEDLEKMLKDGTVNDVNTLMAMYKVKKYLGKSEE